MRMRQHQNYSHPLKPGQDNDFDCDACLLEAAHSISPKITGSDGNTITVTVERAGRAGSDAGGHGTADATGAWIRWAESRGLDTSNLVNSKAYVAFAIAYLEEAKLRLERELAALKGVRRHLGQ